MPYSIGEFARLCGINATTLRAWQRRYGLLKPLRTDGGHRLYSDDDVQQALKILDWVKKGVPVSQVKPLVSRPGARRAICRASCSSSMEQPAGRLSSTTPMASPWLSPKMLIRTESPKLDDIGFSP